jgi:hypothetical protein
MHAKAIISILGFLGASTAVVLPRQEEYNDDSRGSGAGVFDVSDFGVSQIHNSPDTVTYSFYIKETNQAPVGFNTTQCAATTSTGGISDVQSTNCQNDDVSFSFKNNGTGYVLTLAHVYSSPYYTQDRGDAFFPNSDSKTRTNEETQQQGAFLDAPEGFTITYYRVAAA